MGAPIVAGLPGLVTPAAAGLPGAAVGPVGPAPAEGTVIVVTIGTNTNENAWGFNSDLIGGTAYGAVSPGTLEGADLERLIISGGSCLLFLDNAGTPLPQDFFASMELFGTGGPVTFLSGDASFTADGAGNTSRWTWAAANPDWEVDLGTMQDAIFL